MKVEIGWTSIMKGNTQVANITSYSLHITVSFLKKTRHRDDKENQA